MSKAGNRTHRRIQKQWPILPCRHPAACLRTTPAPITARVLPAAAFAGLVLMSTPICAQTFPPATPGVSPSLSVPGLPTATATPAATPTAPTTPVPAPPTPASATTTPAPATATPASGGVAPSEANTIVVSGHSRKYEQRIDPAEAVNAKSFAAVQTADKMVIAPAAGIYEHGLPKPLRDGLHNAIYNFREPTNAIHFLLQHKIGKAAETLARFALNSTMGWGGLFDVAKRKPFNLPHRPNGLADTLGFYGVGPGPYMFLPLIGPTTVRDLIGVTIDRFSAPEALGGVFATPEFGFGITIIGGLDDRLRIAPDVARYRDEVGNPYRAYRDFYLRRRQAEIDALRGRPSGLKTPQAQAAKPVTAPAIPSAAPPGLAPIAVPVPQ